MMLRESISSSSFRNDLAISGKLVSKLNIFNIAR